jgi:sugar phosphate isomerase/epimerase
VFERVKAMGAETVQVSGTGPFDSKFLGKLAKSAGLSVCATHSPFARIRDDIERLAQEHLDFGCPQIGVATLPSEYGKKNADDLKRFAEIINGAAYKLKSYGMTVAYHNHWFEFNKIGDKTVFDALFESFDSSVEFIPDTYWLKLKNVDPAAFIEKLKGRISVLHLKDYRKRLFVPMMKPAGDGVLDFKAIMQSAETCGVKAAVAELDISKDPFGDTEKSLKYVGKIMDELRSV